MHRALVVRCLHELAERVGGKTPLCLVRSYQTYRSEFWFVLSFVDFVGLYFPKAVEQTSNHIQI